MKVERWHDFSRSLFSVFTKFIGVLFGRHADKRWRGRAWSSMRTGRWLSPAVGAIFMYNIMMRVNAYVQTWGLPRANAGVDEDGPDFCSPLEV